MAPNRNIILQWNCQGLKSKREQLDYLISKHHPAVICLQETMLPPEIEELYKNDKPLPSYLNIKGYTPYFKCRFTGRNGVAIYVRNKGTIHSPISLNTPLQSLAIRLTVLYKEESLLYVPITPLVTLEEPRLKESFNTSLINLKFLI